MKIKRFLKLSHKISKVPSTYCRKIHLPSKR